MPLTDAVIRNVKPREKPLKLSDEKGLYLLVTPNGGRWWRFDYRFTGKRKSLSLGVYPDVGLKQARTRRDAARKLLADDIDPSKHRKIHKAEKLERMANSFEAVAREWFSKHSPNWATSHSGKILRRLEADIFPWIGSRPIAEVTAPELLTMLRRIENRGARDTARRAHQNCGQIFRYAVATGRCQRDPSGDLRGALAPPRHKHFAAIIKPAAVGGVTTRNRWLSGYFRCAVCLEAGAAVLCKAGRVAKSRIATI